MATPRTRTGRTTTPPKPGKVFDLDAVIDERARANGGEPFTFSFDGEVYRMPPDFDVRALSALADGAFDRALQILLGPDQWARLEASPKTFGVQAMFGLFDGYAAHLGVDLGEFSASTGS